MPSSSYSRRPVSISVWLAAAVAVVAAVIAAVHLSGEQDQGDAVGLSAAHSKWHRPCAVSTAKVNVWSKTGTYVDKHGATQHLGDGQVQAGTERGCPPPVAPTTAPATTAPAERSGGHHRPGRRDDRPGRRDGPAGGSRLHGLDVLANDCSKSTLPPHTGFQMAPGVRLDRVR